MKFILFLFLLLAVSSFCSCKNPNSSIEELEVADFVFTAEVNSVEYLYPKSDNIYELEILKEIKGKLSSSIEIHTGSGIGDCGFQFKIGKKYLVYAYLEGDRLVTNVCSRTTALDLNGIKEAILLSEKNE